MTPEVRATRDLSRTALVASLHPDSSQFVRLVETAAKRIDWAWVLERATAHKVIALLAARVDQHGLAAHLGEPVATQLHQARAEARARAALALATLRQLDKEFGRARIPFLLVKGSVLAEHVYRDAAARRSFDVDIVVPLELVEAAEGLLRSLGYRLGQIPKLLGVKPQGEAEAHLAEQLTNAFYRGFEYEVPLVPPANAGLMAVDLHWHIASSSRMTVSPRDLWHESMPIAVADVQVTTLTPRATLIHLAVHATTCSFAGFRLLHLCDVGWAAAHFAGRMDGLWELAEAWRVAAHLKKVFEMTERALGVTLPVPTHRGPSRPRTIRPMFAMVACDSFLVGDAHPTRRKRIWTETVWSLAMGCLRHNVLRSLYVRLSRLRWRWQRWRLHARIPA